MAQHFSSADFVSKGVSLVILMANILIKGQTRVIRAAAWYAKEQPTFSYALALVGLCLWSSCHFQASESEDDWR